MVLQEIIWDLPDHEEMVHASAEELKGTVTGGSEQPNDYIMMVRLNNCKCNHHLACHGHNKSCFKRGEEGRCFLPNMNPRPL